MVYYWAADLLPVNKSSSLMPSSGVLLTGGVRASASGEWQPFVHQSTKNSCCVCVCSLICTSDRVLKTPTLTLCKDIYSRKTVRAHFTLPSTTLSYKKSFLPSPTNIEKTALETDSHDIHNESTNIQSVSARLRGSDQLPLRVVLSMQLMSWLDG